MEGTTSPSRRRLEGFYKRSSAPNAWVNPEKSGKPGATKKFRIRTRLVRSSDAARRVDREAESQDTTSGPRRRPENPPDPQSGPAFYSEDIAPLTDEEAGDGRWVKFLTLLHDQGGHYRQRCSAPAAYGGFSDVWQCDTRFADDSKVVVAVKKLRAVSLRPGLNKSQTRKKMLGRLTRELRVWMRLQHPNVAPLIGFNFDGEIAIISPWFSYGNISIYMRDHPEVDKWKLLKGVSDGVLYLHSSTPVIVHGDIKPDNVLIDQGGMPRITDFGLSKIMEEESGLSFALSTSLHEAGNARWTAPELFLEQNASRSLKTDIFSFGCIAFFILSGDVPFKSIPDRQLVIARYKGEHPISEPASYPDLNSRRVFMGVLLSCWNTNPRYRPSIGNIVQSLTQGDPDILSLLSLSDELVEIAPQSSTSQSVEHSTSISSPFGPWSVIRRLWDYFQAFLQRIFKPEREAS